VIIPAYNAEGTILETIQSVRSQTFQDLEIIVINDGSTDKTLEVLQHIKDDRLKIFSYSNGGLPTARNRGITRAQGEFVSFLDADDLWTSDKLERQYIALQNCSNADIAYSWFVCMVEDEQATAFIKGNPVPFVGYVYPQLLLGNFVGNGSNILIRRSAIAAIGEFDPSLKSCEDWDYYLRAAVHSNFVLVPDYQVIYRKAAGSMTSKAKTMEEQGLRVIERAYQSAHPVYQVVKNRTLGYFYRYCAEQYLTYQSSGQAISEARRSLGFAIQKFPAILLDREAQKLLIKLILRYLLPFEVARSLNRRIRKQFTIADPRIVSEATPNPLSSSR
ncbi:glycosyltransferase family 2 protein, partial [Pseudanabaenaceae cyanobacterium LEGE 13415]|nr:glycosyltransferase family 2 protein [Pseudanabaenaceae cyanobacterium LEGE 13415]